MSALVSIALFGWVPASLLAFAMLRPHRAVLVTTIGGWLFLPTAKLDLPGLPPYTKATAIALGLICGVLLIGRRGRSRFVFRLIDLPVIVLCLGSFLTSLSNDLGLYDGFSATFQKVVFWGVPYMFGRIYFTSAEHLRDLALGLVIGGIVYGVLCLYEIRMSPRLNLHVYGFLQHDWRQHKRYGGWRPLVFMHHGLMVALWMALTTIVAFWVWRCRIVTRIRRLPQALATMALAVTAVLCKSAGAWMALALGVGAYYLHENLRMRWVIVVMLLVFPVYVSVRIAGIVSTEQVEALAHHIFDAERVDSLVFRLAQEDPFVAWTLNRPLLGWGGHGRNWPVDLISGAETVDVVDAQWLTLFSKSGLVGLFSFCATFMAGPLLALRVVARLVRPDPLLRIMPVILCLPVGLFLIDSLFNGMPSPVYTLVAGALAGFGVTRPRSCKSNR